MYKVYQIFIMIVKFDIFFQLGFSAQFLSLIVMRYEDNKLFPDDLVLSQQEMTSLIVVHLVLSTGASIILPLLAWWGVSFLVGSSAPADEGFENADLLLVRFVCVI